MIKRINTSLLFRLLLKKINPDLVCDVGSMDAGDSIRFRKVLPDARIFAFEANPDNYQSIINNRSVSLANIQVFNLAVWNKESEIPFFIEHLYDKAGKQGNDYLRGMSSVYKLKDKSLGVTEVLTKSIRLDDFITERFNSSKCIALWIDVEGAAYEVLEGIKKIRDKIKLLHVEVEAREIWHGQKLKTEVKNLLIDMDFILLTKQKSKSQDNAIYIDKSTFKNSSITIKFLVSYVYLLKILERMIPKSLRFWKTKSNRLQSA